MKRGSAVRLLKGHALLTGYLEVDNVYVVRCAFKQARTKKMYVLIVGCPYFIDSKIFRKVVWREQASSNG